MLGRRALPSLNHVLRNISRPASTSASKADNTASSAVTKKADVPPPTIQQSPNYPTTWSTSQRSRPGPDSSPRFEQTAMELQPSPLSAMELIANEPIRLVHGRKAVCDGGMCCLLDFALSFVSSHLCNLSLEFRRRPIGSSKNLHQPGTCCYATRLINQARTYIRRSGSAWTSSLRVCNFIAI